MDAAGGGVIHCTAGTVILVLNYFSNLGRARFVTSGECAPQRDSAVMVLFGTLLMWLGCMILHVLPVADWTQGHAEWVSAQVCFPLHCAWLFLCRVDGMYSCLRIHSATNNSLSHVFLLLTRPKTGRCEQACCSANLGLGTCLHETYHLSICRQ